MRDKRRILFKFIASIGAHLAIDHRRLYASEAGEFIGGEKTGEINTPMSDNLPKIENIKVLRELPIPLSEESPTVFVQGYHRERDGGEGVFIWKSESRDSDNGGTIISPLRGGSTGRWLRYWSWPIDVRWFGAQENSDSKNGIGDANRWAIQAAFDFLGQVRASKKSIFFASGQYLVSGKSTSLEIPQVQGDLSIAPSKFDVQIFSKNLNDVEIDFGTAEIYSDKKDGGYTFLFEGCQNIRLKNVRMRGHTVMVGSSPEVAGTAALGFTSLERQSFGIVIINATISNHYSAIDVTGDPNGPYRVTNMLVDGQLVMSDGYYGIALRNNGDKFIARDCYSLRQNRPFFLYGVTDVSLNIVAKKINGGYQALIKAYQRNTTNIKVYYSVKERGNNQNRLGLQSQHDPDKQPKPAYLQNVEITYDEEAAVPGQSILFSYYRKNNEVAESEESIFRGVYIKGHATGAVVSAVRIRPPSNSCGIDVADFSAPGVDVIKRGEEANVANCTKANH